MSKIDIQQIVYALRRAESYLQAESDRLLNVRDYTAEFPGEDAERMREAIGLLERGEPCQCAKCGRYAIGGAACFIGDPQCPKVVTEDTPVDMVLHCPACGVQHIDAAKIDQPDFDSMPDDPGFRDEHPDWPACVAALRQWEAENWTNPPHRSHLCQGCGHIWRPADVPTNGVEKVQTKGKADSPIPKKIGSLPAVPTE